MKIVKKISFAAASLVALAPLAALAFAAPTGTTLPSASIHDIISSIMTWLLTAVGILAVIGFVIAGILYLTAAGDEEQIGKAKKAMVASIIGVIVALVGVVVIGAVNNMLGASNNF